MPNTQKGIQKKDIYFIIGAIIIFFFGLIVPPFGGITPLGMRMLGVLIGLIFMTCVGCNIILSSLCALLAFVIHGYYNCAQLLQNWTGSTTTFQLVFCGALCLALKESGAMDVIAKKMLGAKICKGRPAVLMVMIMLAGFVTSIFISGAPYFLLYYGLWDSIFDIAGYDEKDPFRPIALLGMYITAYGGFLIPWRGAMAATVAIFNSVLAPFGYEFDAGVYMIIQIFCWCGFDIIYVLLVKYIFKADLSKLAKIDVTTMEQFAKIPDHFNKRMWISLGSTLFCVAYALLVSFAPKTWPGYAIWGSLTVTLIWVVPLIIFGMIRDENGKPYMDVPRLTMNSSMWTMIALVGSLTMLGKVTTDVELGIRGWLTGLFAPVFDGVGIVGLICITVFFTLAITQVVNGQVCAMGITPVIGPIACALALQGIKSNPSVVLTMMNTSGQVAYLTVSGSVNAAYLLNRKEIKSNFLFSKGLIVLVLMGIWMCGVGIAANAIF